MAFTMPDLSSYEQDVRATAKALCHDEPPGFMLPPGTRDAEKEARSRRGRGSAAKGAKGEREVLSALRDVMANVEADATADGLTFVSRVQFTTRKRIEKGTSNRDLGNIPLISVEVKRNETLNVNAAWDQTLRQTDKELLPVLVYRFNREPWRVRTYVALTNPYGHIVDHAVGELSFPDFLRYYGKLYAAYLREGQ